MTAAIGAVFGFRSTRWCRSASAAARAAAVLGRRGTCGPPSADVASAKSAVLVPAVASPFRRVKRGIGASAAPFLGAQRVVDAAPAEAAGRQPLWAFARENRWFFSSSSAAEAADDEYSSATDHFSALGLPRKYDVSPPELKSTYRSLMAELHPDMHAGIPEEEKERMGERAAAVTMANDVLRDDMLRAEHLLELAGMGLDERDGVELVGPGLLMEVMEIREDVDGTSDDPRLKSLLDENKERIASVVDELGVAFAADDYGEARKLTAKLRYWRRIEETITEKIGSVE